MWRSRVLKRVVVIETVVRWRAALEGVLPGILPFGISRAPVAINRDLILKRHTF